MRTIAWSVLAGLFVTLATSLVHGWETMPCDTDARSCTQLVIGYPFAYGIDHWGISVANKVDLLSLLLREDFFRAQHFFADWAIWGGATFVALLLVKRLRGA